MNYDAPNHEFKIFQQIHLIQGTRTIFIDQMTTCIQKDTFYAALKIFNSSSCSLTIVKKEEAKYKVVLRKYLNTRAFYSVDEFGMCKGDL